MKLCKLFMSEDHAVGMTGCRRSGHKLLSQSTSVSTKSELAKFNCDTRSKSTNKRAGQSLGQSSSSCRARSRGEILGTSP